MQVTNSQLKKYLLGSLDEHSNEEIGLQIVADETFEEQLLIAENDLLEDFLDKSLSAEEERLFYENFLIFEDRKKQLEEIGFFRQYSKKILQTENGIEQNAEASKSLLEKIKNLFTFDIKFVVPVLAILIVTLAIGFGWRIFYYNQPVELTALEKEYAELNQKDVGNAVDLSAMTNVNLLPGTFRDSGSKNKLKPENLSDKIYFRLALPFNPAENELLKAELFKDQKTVFRQPEIRVYKNQSGQEIRLVLPKTIFTKGQYQIKIENPPTKDAPVTYNFAVE